MTAQPTLDAGGDALQAARFLLDRMGITPEQLVGLASERPPAPAFAEYVPVVSAAVGAGARRTYGSYWDRILAAWFERRIDEPSPTEIR